MTTKKIILGIDPGSYITGYAIIKMEDKHLKPSDYGCIRPPKGVALSERYAIIYDGVCSLIGKHEVSEMAIETPFFYQNPKTALTLGAVSGIMLLAARQKNIMVYGYTPREVKCALSGTGKATKEQLKRALCRQLMLVKEPSPQDAVDALALAICHAKTPAIIKKKQL